MKIMGFIGIILVFSFLGRLIASFIWNNVIVALFHNLPIVTWYQAWSIMFIFNIVFGSRSSKNKQLKEEGTNDDDILKRIGINIYTFMRNSDIGIKSLTKDLGRTIKNVAKIIKREIAISPTNIKWIAKAIGTTKKY